MNSGNLISQHLYGNYSLPPLTSFLWLWLVILLMFTIIKCMSSLATIHLMVICIMFKFMISVSFFYFILFTFSALGKWITDRGTKDPHVVGRFGHSSVLVNKTSDKKEPYIYVYGGSTNIISGNTYSITDEFLVYDINKDEWQPKNVECGRYPRFRHSSVVYQGFMLIFGGMAPNDTKLSHKGCYSTNTYLYDTVCDTWAEISFTEKELKPPTGCFGVSRYGQSAVAVEKDGKVKMYIFGGFTGTARNDVWTLSLACK